MAYDYVIYHAPCLDGVSSAYVAKQTALCSSSEFIPYDNKTLPLSPIAFQDKWILFLDCLFPEENMRVLFDLSAKITVLDHHKSSLWLVEKRDVMETYGHKLHVDLRQNYSGVMLTWMFFNNWGENVVVSSGTTSSLPWWAPIISDGDLYTWKIEESKKIVTAMKMLEMGKDISTFSTHINASKLFFETKGEQMLETMQSLCANIAESAKICVLSLGEAKYNVGVVESRFDFTNDVGNLICKNNSNVDFAIMFSYKPETGKFSLSLRGIGKVDLSNIAKQISGGGGHFNASGCSVSVLRINDYGLFLER